MLDVYPAEPRGTKFELTSAIAVENLITLGVTFSYLVSVGPISDDGTCHKFNETIITSHFLSPWSYMHKHWNVQVVQSDTSL